MLILIGALASLVIVVATFILLDPFDLNLIGRLTGNYDAIAATMPADVDVYMGINLLNVNQERLTELQTTFQDAANNTDAESDVNDMKDELEDLWQEVEDDFDMTLENDVLPWIGQYAGIGIKDVRFNEWGEPEELDILLAIETRDPQATDDFLAKLMAILEDNNRDLRFDSTTFKEVTIYESDRGYDELALARANNILYIALNARSIRNAIDTEKSNSLAQQEAFKNAIAKLPRDRGLTLFWTPDLVDEWVDEQGGDKRTFTSQGITAVVMAASLVDEGIRLDSVMTYDPDKVSETTAALLADDISFKIDNLLPADTLGYIAGNRLDLSWQIGRDALIDIVGKSDFNEVMDEFEQELGFNPDTDLAPYLNGEWTMALIPSSNNIVAEETGVDLGIMALVGISDAAVLQRVADDLADALEDAGEEVDTLTYEGQPAYEVYDYSNEPTFTYHVGEKFLTLTSSYAELERLAVGDRLPQSDRYKQVWRAFPRGMKPVLYADVTGMITTLLNGLTGYDREDFEQVSPLLQPITAVAAATESSQTLSHQTMLIFIETNTK